VSSVSRIVEQGRSEVVVDGIGDEIDDDCSGEKV
jgi:hypothetical protein